jgi:predicted LPLAT superfamily acyltransferase
MQADRVVDDNTLPVRFFGSSALFPKGPLVLSLISGAPILTSFTLKYGWNRYMIVVEEPIFPPRGRSNRDLVLGELAQEVATRIENVARRYPHQWFNFYPYWIDSPGFKDSVSHRPS